MLPPYDTAATLAKLAAAVMRTRAAARGGAGGLVPRPQRRGPAWARPTGRLCRGCKRAATGCGSPATTTPAPPAGLAGDTADAWHLGPLTLRHEPTPGAEARAGAAGEIAGHLHPVAIVAGAGSAVRRRCFVSDGTRCIMPAFGAYAGGLNFRHPAFAGLLKDGRRIAHALGRDRVYAIPESRCLAGA